MRKRLWQRSVTAAEGSAEVRLYRAKHVLRILQTARANQWSDCQARLVHRRRRKSQAMRGIHFLAGRISILQPRTRKPRGPLVTPAIERVTAARRRPTRQFVRLGNQVANRRA